MRMFDSGRGVSVGGCGVRKLVPEILEASQGLPVSFSGSDALHNSTCGPPRSGTSVHANFDVPAFRISDTTTLLHCPWCPKAYGGPAKTSKDHLHVNPETYHGYCRLERTTESCENAMKL